MRPFRSDTLHASPQSVSVAIPKRGSKFKLVMDCIFSNSKIRGHWQSHYPRDLNIFVLDNQIFFTLIISDFNETSTFVSQGKRESKIS